MMDRRGALQMEPRGSADSTRSRRKSASTAGSPAHDPGRAALSAAGPSGPPPGRMTLATADLLLDLGATAAAERDLGPVLRQALERLRDLVGYTVASIRLVEHGELIARATAGEQLRLHAVAQPPQRMLP